MPPGNHLALHSDLNDFAKYDEFPIHLGGEEVTIYHAQFAKYPLERTARVLYDNLQISPEDYDDESEYASDILDLHDDALTIVRETPGLTVGLHDERYFDHGSYVDKHELHNSFTDLVHYSDSGKNSPEVCAGDGYSLPKTKAELVAGVLTFYNISIAEMEITKIRDPAFDDDLTKAEAEIGLYALRDLFEKEQGNCSFSVPSPSEDTIEEAWQIIEEVGFDPSVDWVYALYIVPYPATYFEPNDAAIRSFHSAISGAFLSGGSGPDRRYVSEDTSDEELEAHREKMGS